MNDIKYTGELTDKISVSISLSEIDTQVDNINKDVEVLYLQMIEIEERLNPVLAPSYPEDVNIKSLMCSISPLGQKLENIHNLLLYRVGHLKDLNSRIKL